MEAAEPEEAGTQQPKLEEATEERTEETSQQAGAEVQQQPWYTRMEEWVQVIVAEPEAEVPQQPPPPQRCHSWYMERARECVARYKVLQQRQATSQQRSSPRVASANQSPSGSVWRRRSPRNRAAPANQSPNGSVWRHRSPRKRARLGL